MSDEEVLARVLAGETALFEILMRRYDQRLFRVARVVLGSADEAEEVMQETWVRAYAHLDQFAHRSRFSTWVTKIAVHEAYARRRRERRLDLGAYSEDALAACSSAPDPERQVLDRELAAAIEKAVDALPEPYRAVFVLREIEGLSTAETGECLELGEEAVKARLHRARRLLRRRLSAYWGALSPRLFPLYAPRCDRVVAAVFRRITAKP